MNKFLPCFLCFVSGLMFAFMLDDLIFEKSDTASWIYFLLGSVITMFGAIVDASTQTEG